MGRSLPPAGQSYLDMFEIERSSHRKRRFQRALYQGMTLELFHNSRALCSPSKGGFFLRKKPLEISGSWVQPLWNRCSRADRSHEKAPALAAAKLNSSKTEVAGAKARNDGATFAARLKSCPVTKPSLESPSGPTSRALGCISNAISLPSSVSAPISIHLKPPTVRLDDPQADNTKCCRCLKNV